MSFAVEVQPDYRAALKEVTHVDGTSRMQTVRPMQNPIFFELLMEFGARTNLFCLLNTSLNIMGEPIVETVADAANFLETVPVYGMAIGDYFIKKTP
jgi:carbamoyltransferase